MLWDVHYEGLGENWPHYVMMALCYIMYMYHNYQPYNVVTNTEIITSNANAISYPYLAIHYSDVTWTSRHLKSLATPLFVQPFVHMHIREKLEAP